MVTAAELKHSAEKSGQLRSFEQQGAAGIEAVAILIIKSRQLRTIKIKDAEHTAVLQ